MHLIKPWSTEWIQKNARALPALPSSVRGRLIPLAGALLLQFGCSGPAVKPSSENETASPAQEIKTLKVTNDALKAKVDALEARITSLTDKLDAAQISLGNLLHSKPATPTAVGSGAGDSRHPSIGTATAPLKVAATDPEKGFASDLAVSQYRDARLLFEAKQLPEAILAFSKFLQQNADHVLAGSAQFYLGECYRARREFRLAIQEYQRLLTAYDRSAHAPAALLSLVLSEEALSLKEASTRHRQQLLSYYPQSPAARQLEAGVTTAPAPAEPATSSPASAQPEVPMPPTKAPVPTAPSPEGPPAPKS